MLRKAITPEESNTKRHRAQSTEQNNITTSLEQITVNLSFEDERETA